MCTHIPLRVQLQRLLELEDPLEQPKVDRHPQPNPAELQHHTQPNFS